MRTLSGSDQFKALTEEVIGAYQQLFPVEKNGHRMELAKIWVDERELDTHDYTSQKKTKLGGGTWGLPVYASLVLKDPNGKVVDKIDKVKLSTIPKLTPRNSFIVKGNEYQVANQMIRKPGAYAVRSQKGDTFKGMIALGGDRTQNLDIDLDPSSNRYTVKVGGSHKPLYPLLKALGASDQDMIKAWGESVFTANKKEAPQHTIGFAKKLTNSNTDNPTTAQEKLIEYAKSSKLDPQVTELTLGSKHGSLSSKLLLDTSKKILDLYQGKATPDDPENLLFKEIRSVEDMIHDKLRSQKEQEAMKRMLSRHLGTRSNLKRMIDFRKLTSPVENFFVSDNRTSTPEQYNPVHMISEMNKLTIHGTGGITSTHAVADKLREVHPSHLGYIDPVHTPESEKIGTTLHMSAGVIKDGRELRTAVKNTKTGKLEFLTPRELHSKVVAFPDEIDGSKFKNPSQVRVQHEGKIAVMPSSHVDYVIPEPSRLFSYATNLVPFLKNDQGNRAVMAAKMLGQTLPLVHREAPLVQTLVDDRNTFHDLIGREFAAKAPNDGIVQEVTADHIKIGNKKVPLYNNFPLNQKTHLHHTPTVKVGDKVKTGQIIADSNFTKNGQLALGTNLKVAYLPYPGLTFEDGIVITESAAKKLAAEQTYKQSFPLEKGKTELNFKRFQGYYPNLLKKDDLPKYDDSGIIKKGQMVQPGQILIAGLHYNLNSPENMSLRKLNKSLITPWSNASVTYNGEFPGIVTDIAKRGDQVQVYVKSVEPAKESDKLSGVHGNKGVITKVVADKDAPKFADGSVPDVFLNPHGVVGRINLGQLYESAAGKIASKTGQPYKIKNFSSEDTNKKIAAELKNHGVSDTETMYTPEGKKIGDVHVGMPHILRLAKTGKAGFSARMPGEGYDANMQPIKGGEEGTKTLDQLTFYSMLSHGAKKNLMDAHIKSEKNDEFWRALEQGKPLPPPKESFAFQKFLHMIRGAGVNTHKVGNEIRLAPLTDVDVKKMSNGEITDPQFFYAKNMKEIPNGFFDIKITGGMNGNRYAHMSLPEKLPNPVFEAAIKNISGLKQPEYEGLLAGTKHLTKDGKVVTSQAEGTTTGGKAFETLLKSVDVQAELAKTRAQLKKSDEPRHLDSLNKKIRILQALDDLGMKPDEAYLRQHIPVIPPMFRPVQESKDRGIVVASPNLLYQNVGILSETSKYPVMKFLPDRVKGEIRSETYKATRAVAGLEPVLTRGKDQPITGFIDEIANETPKQGFFIQKLLSKRQDLVGRGVITSGPELHMDEIGIPEKMAWKVFNPFVVREFGKSGYKPDFARKEIESKTPLAKQMLMSTMKQRTVLMNRAPSLHKFSIMAHKPVLTDSLAIKVPPLVLKGYGGDFDGDAVNIHVPTTEEALRESHKMLPSQNLFKPGTGELMTVPSQESQIGIYFMSQNPEGRKKLNSVLPPKYHVSEVLDGSKSKALYNRLANELPKEFPNLVQKLKLMGDEHAYERGFTTSIKDLQVDTKLRDAMFHQADQQAAALRKAHKPGPELDRKIADMYEGVTKEAYKKTKDQLKKTDNSFYHMVSSGAKGKDDQLMQIVSAPGIVVDAKDRKVPVPIKKSYAEGVTTSDYFVSAYGVRKGMIDRALATSKPGALNKDIMAATINNLVSADDCGTKKGAVISVDSSDVLDRYLAHDQHGSFRNTQVTPQLVSVMKRKGVKSLTVRSPLKCLETKGTCAHCFGIDEHGKRPEIGENIGAKMGQTMSEPVTQMTMRTFHTGGVSSGSPQASGFKRVSDLLSMPKYVAGEAATADITGTVTKIGKSPAGGFHIHVGDKQHTVRPGLSPAVKIGDSVKIGDKLSEGVLNPHKLLRQKGMGAAQEYIVDELKKTFAEQGVHTHRKVFETVIRSVADSTLVKNAPKHTGVLPGDLIPFTAAEHYNESRKVSVRPEDSVGYNLANPIGSLPRFHEISEKDLPKLKSAAHSGKIDVVKDPIVHTPQLEGITRVPLLRKDWMSQLGYRYVKQALTQGAAESWSSDLSGRHPVPAFAYGASFGKKKESY
jgi:DNA-directed RNA polymerase subunit beta'